MNKFSCLSIIFSNWGKGEAGIHAVVSLAYLSSGPMGDKLGAFSACNLNLTTGDARPRYRSAQQVPVFVDCIRLNSRPDEILHKLFSQVFNENLRRNRRTEREQASLL